MAMSFTTLTELRYPNLDGPVPTKWDYFYMENESLLPSTWLDMTMDEKYDFLNNGGYWTKGHWEISPEQDEFIEENDLGGSQKEVVVSISEDLC